MLRLYKINNFKYDNLDLIDNILIYSILDNAGYLIKTQGCKIPEMYLNGPDIEKYMKKRESLNCKSKWNYTLPLVTSNLTALTLNISAWATLNITKRNPLFKCYYVPIKRLKFKEDQMKKEFYDENDVK